MHNMYPVYAKTYKHIFLEKESLQFLFKTFLYKTLTKIYDNDNFTEQLYPENSLSLMA